MDLDRVTVVIRPRDPWQAMDIGVALARKHFWQLWRLWLCTAVPLAVLSVLVGLIMPWSGARWALPFFWLFLPLCELPVLLWISRVLFGQQDSLGGTLRKIRNIVSRKTLWTIIACRLSPRKGLIFPVLLLEQLQGADRKERLTVLSGDGDKLLYLSVACFFLDIITSFSLMPILNWFIPQELRWIEMKDFIFTPDGWLFLLSYFTTVSISGPFYVCCGFLIYISRRVELEGWDIEIGFKRIAQRLALLKNGDRPKTSVLLCLFLVPWLFLARPVTAASPASTPEEAKALITTTLEDREFGEMVTGYRWEPIAKAQKQDNSAWQEFWEKLGAQVSEFVEKIIPVIAELSQFLLLLSAGIVIGLLLWKYRAIKQWLMTLGGPAKLPPETPEVMFGLDLRPASLPPDIALACRELLARQQLRETLGLLYRASLSHLINRHQLPIEASFTESQCRDLVSGQRPSSEARFFHELTELWMRVAYGHRLIEDQLCFTLLEQYQTLFGEVR